MFITNFLEATMCACVLQLDWGYFTCTTIKELEKRPDDGTCFRFRTIRTMRKSQDTCGIMMDYVQVLPG